MKEALPPLIDSHCHLSDPVYSGKEQDYLERARKAGTRAVLSVGIDLATSRKAIEQAEKFSNVFAAVGLHPHDASTIESNIIESLRGLIDHEKVVAIGETGLDYYYEYSARDVQRKAFAGQIILARESGLPLVVHSRNAVGDCIEVIRHYGKGEVKGVFHCFSGTEEEAFEVLRLGFYLSFAGNITFKGFSAAYLSHVSLDRILVETDAPYLTPVPFRGKTNEPAYLPSVLIGFSRFLKSNGLEEVAAQTTRNTLSLFGIGEWLRREVLDLLNEDID